MKLSTVGALALCGSLLLATAAIAAPSHLAILDIFVVDQDGNAVSDTLVVVETSRGDAFFLFTDEEGRATVELKIRGQESLDLSISTLGGSSLERTLERGDSLTVELIAPATKGYEWIWVD